MNCGNKKLEVVKEEIASTKFPIKQLKKKLPLKKCETKPGNVLVRQRKEQEMINCGRKANIHQTK